MSTDYRYTGQRWEDGLGPYYYGARWYDPYLNRFIQPDTIVPQPGNPQSLNRYSYGLNNPVKYVDREGHNPLLAIALIGAGVAAGYVEYQQVSAYAAAHDMTFWQAFNDPNLYLDQGAMIEAAVKGAALTAMTSQAVGVGLAGLGALLQQAGMALDSSGRLFATGTSLQLTAAMWNSWLLNGSSAKTAETQAQFATKGFASPEKLTEHFLKHGSEFGYQTEQEYLAAAQRFVSVPNPDVLLKVRSSGDVVIFNPMTNEFAVVALDGTIRTYYIPDPSIHHAPTNLDYFNRQ